MREADGVTEILAKFLSCVIIAPLYLINYVKKASKK